MQCEEVYTKMKYTATVIIFNTHELHSEVFRRAGLCCLIDIRNVPSAFLNLRKNTKNVLWF